MLAVVGDNTIELLIVPVADSPPYVTRRRRRRRGDADTKFKHPAIMRAMLLILYHRKIEKIKPKKSRQLSENFHTLGINLLL